MNRQSISDEIIGSGWHFPVRVDVRRPDEYAPPGRGSGGIALARVERDVEQAIRIVLGTAKGERRMRPAFGCDIHTLVFAPANATTFGLMRQYVDEALTMWEPRILVRAVEVEPAGEGMVEVGITYELRATKDERTLVYPFYIAGEDGP
jgi:phage baseplate assembly protein W